MSKVFEKSDSFKRQNLLEGDHDPVWEETPQPMERIVSDQLPATPPQAATDSPPSFEKSEERPQQEGEQPVEPPQLKEETPTSHIMETERESEIHPPPSPPPLQEGTDMQETSVSTPENIPDPIDLEALAQEQYDLGYQECLNNLHDDYVSSTRALTTVFTEINSLRETILNNSMKEMQQLVFKIAEKILRVSVTEQNNTIIHTVEEAIRRAVKSDEFVIQVNPSDYEVIEKKSADFINSLSGLENIVVKPDSKIEQGGCKIESSNCTVDATIEVQLEVIKDKIQENS